MYMLLLESIKQKFTKNKIILQKKTLILMVKLINKSLQSLLIINFNSKMVLNKDNIIAIINSENIEQKSKMIIELKKF